MPQPTTRLPSYAVSKADAALISRIAERAVVLAERHGRRVELLGVCANLTACHANGCPLDLASLLNADDAAFAHDVWGIGRHLDRVTGTLTRFHPSCAKGTGKREGIAKGALGGSTNTSDGATDSIAWVSTNRPHLSAATGEGTATSEDKTAA